MQTTLHEQQGLRIWTNEGNGFTICRLHYTADPRKRSEEWKAAAARGMSGAKFRQEFEIDYQAGQGEKAFPEMQLRRGEIVCKEGPYVDNDWPTSLPMWGGFDYGARNPSSFHVYCVVDGTTWAIWELYKPCKNLFTFSEEMKACPYWNQIRYICHDPDIGNLHSRNTLTGDVEAIASQFERAGIRKLVPGNNDESAWLAQMQKHWCGSEITFKILETCPMMIDEFEQATFISMSDRQLETQNYREALVDRHNHSLDDCKYFMNSGAARTRPNRPTAAQPMVAGYGWASSGESSLRSSGRYSELGF